MIRKSTLFFVLFVTSLSFSQSKKQIKPANPPEKQAGSAQSSARGIDPSLFGAMRWRQVGPFRGGRVLAVTGVPGEPNVFYFGAASGGIWKSMDAGGNWAPIFRRRPWISRFRQKPHQNKTHWAHPARR